VSRGRIHRHQPRNPPCRKLRPRCCRPAIRAARACAPLDLACGLSHQMEGLPSRRSDQSYTAPVEGYSADPAGSCRHKAAKSNGPHARARRYSAGARNRACRKDRADVEFDAAPYSRVSANPRVISAIANPSPFLRALSIAGPAFRRELVERQPDDNMRVDENHLSSPQSSAENRGPNHGRL